MNLLDLISGSIIGIVLYVQMVWLYNLGKGKLLDYNYYYWVFVRYVRILMSLCFWLGIFEQLTLMIGAVFVKYRTF